MMPRSQPASISAAALQALWGVCLAAVLLVAGTGCERESGPTSALDTAAAQADAPRRQGEIVVFAAASLTEALEALTDSFRTENPDYEVVLNVSAASRMARQIHRGAAADVFFSDDEGWMQFLESRGHVTGAVHTPLSNRLVVVGPADAEPFDSVAALPRAARLAVADPTHAPPGLYAKQALRCAGLWETMQPKILPTLDVRSALVAVGRDPLTYAMVYGSDAPTDTTVQSLMVWPEACQPPIRYTVARLENAHTASGAEAWIRYVTDPARDAFWRMRGFIPLDEPPVRAQQAAQRDSG